MLEMLMQWYRRRFSDPEAIALLVILVAGFGILFFFSGLLAPLLVAIVLAYLLEWPTARLEHIGCSRRWATSIVLVLFVGILLLMAFVVMPVAWQQGINLIRDMPGMLNKLSDFAATLPRRYPALMDAGIIDAMAENMRARIMTMGDSVVKYSLASLVGLLTLAVYLVLVPLMVFFLVKDKDQMLNAVRRILPRNRGLAGQVWEEMNQQITNYIRGKVLEMIVVGVATWIGFLIFGLNYSLLLDEPAAGMTDAETEYTAELFKTLAGKHSLMVVEHDMGFVETIADHVTVLHQGRVLAEGSLREVQANEQVIEVYLGR